MAPAQTEIPLKSIKDVAEEQAEKAVALVAKADALAAISGRTRTEELQDLMMARLTDAAIKRQRRESALVTYEDSIDRINTFISGNGSNVDPQRILLNLTRLLEGLQETVTRLKQEPI